MVNIGNSNSQKIAQISVSKRLAVIALAFWLASLFLPGLVFTYGSVIHGYQILLEGWLGILALIVSWYANPLFLYACWKLISTKEASENAAIFSLCIGTTMFFYKIFPTGSGSGAERVLYGLGWGAFLWYIALLLVVLASNARQKELDGSYKGYKSLWGLSQGKIVIVGLVVWAGLAIAGLGQWASSVGTEREKLAKVIIRPGKVCTTPDYKVRETIPFTGALEVESDKETKRLSLSSPDVLTRWGVPVVRIGRFDYFRLGTPPDTHLVAGPPVSTISARLTTSSPYGSWISDIRARLATPDNETVAFDARWTSKSESTSDLCPGYFHSAEPHQPPRSLLLSALGLNGAIPIETKKKNWWFHKSELKSMTTKSVSFGRKIKKSDYKGNMGCDPDIGIRRSSQSKGARESETTFIAPQSWESPVPNSSDYLYSQLFGLGARVVQIRDRFHFVYEPIFSGPPEVVCSESYIYLSTGAFISPRSAVRRTVRFNLQKRSIDNFQKEWQTNRYIEFNPPPAMEEKHNRRLYIYSVKEKEGDLVLELAYFGEEKNEATLIEVVASDK